MAADGADAGIILSSYIIKQVFNIISVFFEKHASSLVWLLNILIIQLLILEL